MTTPEGIREAAMSRFEPKARAKYNRGQREHGGILSETVVLNDLEDEIIDLWFYLCALRTKLKGQNEEAGCHSEHNLRRGA